MSRSPLLTTQVVAAFPVPLQDRDPVPGGLFVFNFPFLRTIARSGSRAPKASEIDPPYAASAGRCPNKPRGVPRVDDRRVLNGIFWVLRTGASWRALPKEFGPRTTCYNRFVWWELKFGSL